MGVTQRRICRPFWAAGLVSDPGETLASVQKKPPAAMRKRRGEFPPKRAERSPYCAIRARVRARSSPVAMPDRKLVMPISR